MSWPYPAAPNSSQMEYGVIQRLLDDAKQQLVQGNPQQALQSVLALLSAMQLHGEVASAAFKVRDAMATDPSRDVSAQLAGLLGALSLGAAESAQPSSNPLQDLSLRGYHNVGTNHININGGSSPMVEQMQTEVDNGQRLQNISLAADGEASYVCERCGSVISVARQAAHEQSWCSALHTGNSNTQQDDSMVG